MDIGRSLRHLFTTARQVRRAFPAATLQAIEDAIRRSERTHSGDICFAIEGALDAGALWQGQSARARAIEVFSLLRVWDTEFNNGVLIHVLLADRAVEIVADRGIDARVGAVRWQQICNDIEAAFGHGDYRQGALGGIEAVTRCLVGHFPADEGASHPLPDRPVVL